jgi:hypothetical protein
VIKISEISFRVSHVFSAHCVEHFLARMERSAEDKWAPAKNRNQNETMRFLVSGNEAVLSHGEGFMLDHVGLFWDSIENNEDVFREYHDHDPR